MRYHIPIKPISWKRAGTNFEEKRFYDQQKHEKLAVGLHFRKQHAGQPLFKAPSVISYFYFNDSQKHRLLGEYPWYSQVPDIDRLENFYFDAMKGIVFEDDRNIVHAESFKFWADEDYVDIIVREMFPEKLVQLSIQDGENDDE